MKRIKGSPRRLTRQSSDLHAKAKQLPTQAALDEFIELHPRAERARLRELIHPHTRFDARAERQTSIA